MKIHFINVYGINKNTGNMQICAITACGKNTATILQRGNYNIVKGMINCKSCKKAIE